MKIQRFSLPLVAALLLTSLAQAQITTPQPSPGATVSQKVGLTDVSIAYSRPSVKGRKIFGDLVPFAKIWRTGANQATKFTFSDEVTVGGKKLAAGEYSLFTIPGKEMWTIVFNRNPKASTAEYKESEDAVRFQVKPLKNAMTESFTIGFADVASTAANVEISWEKTKVKFPITVDVDSKVIAQINEKIPTATENDANLYYQAALYYYDTNREAKTALEWITKATAKEPKFWHLHLKAKLQARLGDYSGAIITARQSLELSRTANNEDYVRLNEKLIAEWQRKV